MEKSDYKIGSIVCLTEVIQGFNIPNRPYLFSVLTKINKTYFHMKDFFNFHHGTMDIENKKDFNDYYCLYTNEFV